jgi:hypothetical protein
MGRLIWVGVSALFPAIACVSSCVGDTAAADGGADGSSDVVAEAGPTPDTGGADVNADAAACNPSAPFNAPVLYDVNVSGVSNLYFRLNGDETMGVWQTREPDGGPSMTLLQSQRASRADKFSSPVPLTEFAQWGREPWLSADGLGLYLDPDVLNWDAGQMTNRWIYRTTRSTTGNPFTIPPELVPNINAQAADEEPFVSTDQKEIFYTGTPGGTDAHDLYESRVVGDFQTGTLVTELNSAFDDVAPVLSADGLTLYFASDRTGTLGDTDIWVAKRADRSSPFAPPANVTQLNSADGERPNWVSADGCEIFFHRQPVNGLSSIYRATRPQ